MFTYFVIVLSLFLIRTALRKSHKKAITGLSVFSHVVTISYKRKVSLGELFFTVSQVCYTKVTEPSLAIY